MGVSRPDSIWATPLLPPWTAQGWPLPVWLRLRDRRRLRCCRGRHPKDFRMPFELASLRFSLICSPSDWLLMLVLLSASDVRLGCRFLLRQFPCLPTFLGLLLIFFVHSLPSLFRTSSR